MMTTTRRSFTVDTLPGAMSDGAGAQQGMFSRFRSQIIWVFLLLITLVTPASAEERFPPPEFRISYSLPTQQVIKARGELWAAADVLVLAAALVVAAYFVHRKRSRVGVFVLTAFSIAYFGFYREGCVCAVGSIQNVTASLVSGGGLAWWIAAFFALPLITALFAGRLFCAGVCPLGAIQDVMLWRPIQLPRWLESSLGLFPHLYLGVAVLLAATGTEFAICRWDPFVGFFRMSGTLSMLLIGAAFLAGSMFVGRIYCRFICPYSVLLRAFSRFAKWKVHVSPAECTDCRLCEKSCSFGAIKQPARDSDRPAVSREAFRRRTRITLAVGVALLILLPLLGYFTKGALARLDTRVDLALRIQAEDSGRIQGTSEESSAWRKTGETTDVLYARAAAIEYQLGIGGALLGTWMALAITVRLMRQSLPAPVKGYDADTAACLGCARCFDYCPVKRGSNERVLVTTSSASARGSA